MKPAPLGVVVLGSLRGFEDQTGFVGIMLKIRFGTGCCGVGTAFGV